MSLAEAVERLLDSQGEFFTVEFVKRTTGETRVLTGRTGVHKDLKGTGHKYDPAAHKLLPVYDIVNHGYRSIPVDAITRLKVNGSWVDVTRG